MGTPSEHALNLVTEAASLIASLPLEQQVKSLNACRKALHKVSPFSAEPVDCVQWVPMDCVEANDYNPNSVAPPEMELLRHSISADGYTQPIVAWDRENCYEVVDGFHRNRVGRECPDVGERIQGYLPLAVIKGDRSERNDRIAATIRHNRARGKHKVSAMSDIVTELKRRNWSDKRIGKELGMDPDEVLRLSQIGGLAEVFADEKFSEAWEPTLGVADEFKNIENGDITLDWVTSPLDENIKEGWHDRTEQSSVLYGTSQTIKGLVQKSRVEDKWHWYAYAQPLVSGEVPTKQGAKSAVTKAWKGLE